MEHQFSNVPNVEMPRATFDRSHSVKTTFDAGKIIPIFVDEILPGDTININMNALARLNTPLTPIMHDMYLDTFWFFTPYRLLWDNWRKFCGEQTDPGDSIAYTIPYVASDVAGYGEQSIFDYFGLPTKVTTSFNHSALPLRAYRLIWSEWFRDQNLQNTADISTGDGPDLFTAVDDLLVRGKRHDYFTACLPWLQKGTAVNLPLGTDAPVIGIGTSDQVNRVGPVGAYETDGTGLRNYATYQYADGIGGNDALYIEDDPNNTGYPNIRADLTNATAATVNEVRLAFQTQKLLERDARAGTRYKEIVKSHFGVDFMDVTYRPEYLGGSTHRLELTPVAQTSETATTEQGALTAVGAIGVNDTSIVKSFTEHGVLIGLVSARADLVYQEGLERMWSNSTRYDIFWPSLAHIGEQAVLNKEIYCDGSANDDDVFGYIPRYDHYRYKNSKVTGLFRSNCTASLDSWHLAQEFGALPTLNSTFIEENPPVDRVIATPAEPHFNFDGYIRYKHTRPMPMFSVPGMIDHF